MMKFLNSGIRTEANGSLPSCKITELMCNNKSKGKGQSRFLTGNLPAFQQEIFPHPH